MKDDTISRAAALKGLDDLNIASFYEENEHSKEAYTEVKAMLKALPSATDTNVGGNLIDRQAAISEIMEDIKDRSLHDDPATPEDYAEGYDEGIRNAAAIVLQMPSAQPEIIRCKDCRYNNDCEIQYSAQSADEFFCGCAERKDNE